jgi:hypothetical protein
MVVVLLAAVGASIVLLADEKVENLPPLDTGARGSAHGEWIRSVDGSRAELWAVGDANPPKATRVVRLVRAADPDRIIYLGDVYETGTAAEFDRWAEPWKGLLDRMAPTPGNHEWRRARQGYLPFWRRITGEEPPNRYTFDAGGWRILSLNSQVRRSAPTRRWLRKQVRTGGDCRVAFWHRPRFSAGSHSPGARGPVRRYWDILEGHARIVLGGHDHNLQRFRQHSGSAQFVSGAGGRHLHSVDERDDRLAFADDEHYGALRLRLSPTRARWAFIAANGQRLDEGTLHCRA